MSFFFSPERKSDEIFTETVVDNFFEIEREAQVFSKIENTLDPKKYWVSKFRSNFFSDPPMPSKKLQHYCFPLFYRNHIVVFLALANASYSKL